VERTWGGRSLIFQDLQGFLIAFDGPGRAIPCGMSISRQVGARVRSSGIDTLISRISRRISNGTSRSAAAVRRFAAPAQSKTGAVPTDHGTRLHNRQHLAVFAPTIQANKDQAIRDTEGHLSGRCRRWMSN
jgi:hypothetical protein